MAAAKKIPSAITALLTKYKGRKTPLHYHAPVKLFAGELEVTLDGKSAGARIADDSDDDDASETAAASTRLPLGY